MDYLTLKSIHVASVAASYALFFVRGVWMMRSPQRLQRRWVKVVPHAVDTVLLASAVALAIISHQYPFAAGWLTAKVIALVLYIALGMVALHYGKSMRARITAWIAAQCVFLYIVAVALTREPLLF